MSEGKTTVAPADADLNVPAKRTDEQPQPANTSSTSESFLHKLTHHHHEHGSHAASEKAAHEGTGEDHPHGIGGLLHKLAHHEKDPKEKTAHDGKEDPVTPLPTEGAAAGIDATGLRGGLY